MKDISLFDSAFYNYTTDVATVSIPLAIDNPGLRLTFCVGHGSSGQIIIGICVRKYRRW
jgi:hypothetical protein